MSSAATRMTMAMTTATAAMCARGYVSKCRKWLESVERERGIKIQHAGNGGEKVLFTSRGKPLYVDGFTIDTDPPTVFEYHGDFWHGNPDKFHFFGMHPVKNCYNGELYIRTIRKEEEILRMGYALETRWECEDEGMPAPKWKVPDKFPLTKKPKGCPRRS